MATRGSSSSSNTILLIFILLITFPFWMAIGGICIGLIAGAFGIVIGVLGAVFGALISIVTWPFHLVFGDWGHHDWPHFHGNGFITLSIIIVIALALRAKRR